MPFLNYTFRKGLIIRSIHIQTKEEITATLSREGGLQSINVSGDMNLIVSDAANAKIKLMLSDEADTMDVQFKQHPNIAKFTPGEPKVISMKDAGRGFLVGQFLTVLRWRYKGNDERWTPLSSENFTITYDIRH